jgi:uncharacterized protein YecT (DUF1311 family)
MKLYKVCFLISLFLVFTNVYAEKYEYTGTCNLHNFMEVFDECLDKELATYDKELNVLYNKLYKTKYLKKAERFWIKFREADCDYMARSVNEGKEYQAIEKACSINKTKERIADLKRSYFYSDWFKSDDG